MEKRNPTYDLESIRRVCGSVETLAMTGTALRDAARLGYDRRAIAQTMARLDKSMFFKSMTTFGDHRIWQDVYHVPADDLVLYVKVQADVVTTFTVMSFKEK